MDPIQRKIQQIKTLLTKVYFSAKDAHDILFKDSTNKENELIAATYLNKSISLMSTVESIYYSDIEELEHTEMDDIIHKFHVYESEFLSNLSTNHSHQWTDIEFINFKDVITRFLDLEID